MELTAKSISQLLKELRGDGGELSKRKQPRVGLRVRTTIKGVKRETQSVWLRDLSSGGANFVGPLEYEPREMLRMASSDDDKEFIHCEVVHCRELGQGMFSTGVKFHQERWR